MSTLCLCSLYPIAWSRLMNGCFGARRTAVVGPLPPIDGREWRSAKAQTAVIDPRRVVTSYGQTGSIEAPRALQWVTYPAAGCESSPGGSCRSHSEVEASQKVGDASRLVGTLNLHCHADGHLHTAPWKFGRGDERCGASHSRSDYHRRWKPHPISTVVDPHSSRCPDDFMDELSACQGERQVAMCDAAAVGPRDARSGSTWIH